VNFPALVVIHRREKELCSSLPGDEIMADLDSSLFSRRSAESAAIAAGASERSRNRGAHCRPNAVVRSARKRRFLGVLLGFVSYENELRAIRGNRGLSDRDIRDRDAAVTVRVTDFAQLLASPALAFRRGAVLSGRASILGTLGHQKIWKLGLLDDRSNDRFRILRSEDTNISSSFDFIHIDAYVILVINLHEGALEARLAINAIDGAFQRCGGLSKG
jgi:hypothetical protein